MGTVELTGLAMIPRRAFGATLAAAWARSRTIEALACVVARKAGRSGQRPTFGESCASLSVSYRLTLKRSSRVMPGLRGMPAGMRMISAPSRAFSRPPSSGP